MYSVRVFLLNEDKNDFKLYVWILLLIYLFFSFSFSLSLLLDIKMETNNHSNLTFLYAFKSMNWNHQLLSYSRRNRNGSKIFILIFHSHVSNMALG